MSDIADYVDALDHIMRVARKSRTQSRRLRWIEARARCALEGGEDWKELDLPKFSESNQRYLQTRVAELEQQLAAAQAELRECCRYPKHTTPRSAITFCDNCGCSWLDDGLNPIGCPYCKQSAEIERDEALLRQALEALERGAWDTLSGRNAAFAIRERLGLAQEDRND